MENEVAYCIKILESGGTLLYPTDTIWGIGSDATQEKAIRKVINIKDRDKHKSMLILCCELEQVENFVETVPDQAKRLIAISDRPLTLIYPKAKNLPDNLLASDGSIGIRIPKHDFCLALIRKLGNPIVSTSANISGEPSPISFQNISQELIRKVDYVANFERDKISQSIASSIIKITETGELIEIR